MTSLPLPKSSALTRPYWDAAKRSELAFQRCASCGVAFLYPRPSCPACWSLDPVWETASGGATLLAFSVVHQPPYASYEPRVPYVVAMVALDEGPQLMTNILHCQPEAVRVGMKLAVTFEQRGEWALPQFKPAEETP